MLEELELGLLALGLALEPEAALPDGLLELAPPLAWSFFESLELDAEPDIEPEGDVLDEDGEDGEVVEPADEDAEPEGEVVEPEGEVLVLLRDAARSPVLSQAAISAEPRATETASAIGVNLMWPPWLGYSGKAARIGPGW